MASSHVDPTARREENFAHAKKEDRKRKDKSVSKAPVGNSQTQRNSSRIHFALFLSSEGKSSNLGPGDAKGSCAIHWVTTPLAERTPKKTKKGCAEAIYFLERNMKGAQRENSTESKHKASKIAPKSSPRHEKEAARKTPERTQNQERRSTREGEKRKRAAECSRIKFRRLPVVGGGEGGSNPRPGDAKGPCATHWATTPLTEKNRPRKQERGVPRQFKFFLFKKRT